MAHPFQIYIEGQLARFIEELSQYKFKILHRKGILHENADAISIIREPFKSVTATVQVYQKKTSHVAVVLIAAGYIDSGPGLTKMWTMSFHLQSEALTWTQCIQIHYPKESRELQLPGSSNFQGASNSQEASNPREVPHLPKTSNWTVSLSSHQLSEAQRNDPNIGIVMHWIEHKNESATRELQLSGPETRALWFNREQIVFQDRVMYYSWTYREGRSRCLIVPIELRDRILYFCHDSKDFGHLGQSKALDKLKEKFDWYGMSKDCITYVKRCSTCNKNKKGKRTHRCGLELYHASFPLDRVHLDILGRFNLSNSDSVCILVLVDQFTKWVELAALPAQTAELTAHAFLNYFIVTFGCPLEIHSDQGRNFESNLFQAF